MIGEGGATSPKLKKTRILYKYHCFFLSCFPGRAHALASAALRLANATTISCVKFVKFLQYVLFRLTINVRMLQGGRMSFFKWLDGISFFYNYIVSGFSNGGSWKIDRITELNSAETRKILIRNMSTYEELFTCQQRVSQ